MGHHRSIGGVTEIVCTDNLSAATHELKKTGGRSFGKRYTALSEHAGFVPRRINVRCSNENGIVERGHGIFKAALEQDLIVRGYRDFRSVEEYIKFVDTNIAYECSVFEEVHRRETMFADVTLFSMLIGHHFKWFREPPMSKVHRHFIVGFSFTLNVVVYRANSFCLMAVLSYHVR